MSFGLPLDAPMSVAARVSPTPIFQLEGVSYRYFNRQDALLDLDLVVYPGEQIANLIHEHVHHHGELAHSHLHSPADEHIHEHMR